MEKTSRGSSGTVSANSNGAEGALDKVSSKAHAAVDAIAGVAEDAASTLQATQKKLVGDTCEYISGNPLKAVGVALVAGFLLSRIIIK